MAFSATLAGFDAEAEDLVQSVDTPVLTAYQQQAQFADTVTGPTPTLTATIRDFFRGDMGGHPDFNTSMRSIEGLRQGAVERELSADRRPVFATVRPSQPSPYSNAACFDQWFRDVPAVNHVIPIELAFSPRADDPSVLTIDGYNANHFHGQNFFPIRGLGFGNEGHPNNYSFTTRVVTDFTCNAGSTLKFVGDDDVWAFINGDLAIDLGGVHPSLSSQVILLDGRMFVELDKIPVGGKVQPSDASGASHLQTNWNRQGMCGSLPAKAGTHGWVDFGLAIGDDGRCVFDVDNLEVTVHTDGPPPTEVQVNTVSGRAEVHAWGGNGAAYARPGRCWRV